MTNLGVFSCRFAFLLIVALLLFLAEGGGRPAQAANIAVNTTNDELNSDGDCSLREAITAANTDATVDACTAGSGADTITLPAGTYTLSIVSTGEDAAADGDFDITEDVTITGAGAATTIIDGNSVVTLDRVFEVDPLKASGIALEMSGVTVRNGHEAIGGSILNYGSLTITDSIVTANTSDGVAGGLFNELGASMELTNVTVSGNTAAVNGGGIWSDGDLLVTDSTISGNTATAGDGGGIYSHTSGTLVVTGSTVSGNSAGGNGGGIYNGGTLAVVDSTVSGNSAPSGSGGGIENEAGTATVSNSTISGNNALSGGGVDNRSALTLGNDTITANTASSGGGIWAFDATLVNTIVAMNTSGNDCFVTVGTTSSYSLDSDGSCGLSGTGDLSNTDPMLGSLTSDGGANKLEGRGGNDTLKGNGGADVLRGNGGRDVLKGSSGNDKLEGGVDADTLYGNGSNDRLYGQAGNDKLHGGVGTDACNGGPGTNTKCMCEA